MKAIILAAGRGSRMRSLTNNSPKCLVKIFGKTLLEWQIMALKNAGVEQIGIVGGYKNEALIPFIKSQNLIAFHNKNWEQTNMISSLLCAREWISGSEFIISYSDIFYKANGIRTLINLPCDVGILYAKNWKAIWEARFGEKILSDAESFKIDSALNLIEIGKKVKDISEIQGQFMGILKFGKDGFEKFLEAISVLEIAKIDTTFALQKFLEAGNNIKCVEFDGAWGECDNENDIKIYEKMYNKNALDSAKNAESTFAESKNFTDSANPPPPFYNP
ncbi:phosphocholine cytidylyltransferase family protein [Helicobacter sp. 23-1045]